MHTTEREAVFLVLLIAVLAPVLAELIPRVRFPGVVLEIVLGALVGPQILAWADPGPILNALSRFGMGFLRSNFDGFGNSKINVAMIHLPTENGASSQ